MNNQGLFGWIRDGVKQSVLLGVSDAIDTIGAPDASDHQLHPVLLSFAQQGQKGLTAPADVDSTVRTNPMVSGPGRKRLGRSLKDIEPTKSISQ